MITRPPPPSGPPPMYAVASRAFGRTNLRPVVIGACISTLIWSLVWSAGAFRDMTRDHGNEMQPLIDYDIIFGALYAAIVVIEILGLTAAITQRTPLARLFVGLSLVAVVCVAAAEIVRTIGHFKFKGPIIDQCRQASLFGSNNTASTFWGGSSGDSLTPDEATDFCTSMYNRSSGAAIAWLLLSIIFALFFASIAFSFYRQLLDPNTFRAARAPSDQIRLDALRHQEQPFGAGYMPYPGFNEYAPPPGPPPGTSSTAPPYEDGRLPGYGGEFTGIDKDDKKDADKISEDPFMDAQYTGGREPSA